VKRGTATEKLKAKGGILKKTTVHNKTRLEGGFSSETKAWLVTNGFHPYDKFSLLSMVDLDPPEMKGKTSKGEMH